MCANVQHAKFTGYQEKQSNIA